MKKVIVAMLLLMTFNLAACGSEQENVSEPVTEQETEAEENQTVNEEASLEESEDTLEADAEVEEESTEAVEKDAADWKTAYLDIVNEWNGQHSGEGEIGYELINLDEDDIPELALFCDDDAWYAMDFYTFTEGSAKKPELEAADWDESQSPYFSPGWQGKGDQVCEGKGIYFQTRGMMGDQRTNVYRLENGVFHKIIFYDYMDLSWDEENKDPYSYILEYTDKEGKDVSVEKSVKEEDDYFEMANIPEAKELEETFGFSFSDRKDLNEGKVSFDDIVKLLGE